MQEVSTVCKQLHQICHGYILGTTNIIIPVLEISASSENDNDTRRTEELAQQLVQQCTKLQCYRKATIIDGHKFKRGGTSYDELWIFLESNQFKLNGVVSLYCLFLVKIGNLFDTSLLLTLVSENFTKFTQNRFVNINIGLQFPCSCRLLREVRKYGKSYMEQYQPIFVYLHQWFGYEL